MRLEPRVDHLSSSRDDFRERHAFYATITIVYTATTVVSVILLYALVSIAALDFGAKKSIFRELAFHGFEVHVFPATASIAEIKAIDPEGIFLSNGPGDPEAVTYDLALHMKQILKRCPMT